MNGQVRSPKSPGRRQAEQLPGIAPVDVRTAAVDEALQAAIYRHPSLYERVIARKAIREARAKLHAVQDETAEMDDSVAVA